MKSDIHFVMKTWSARILLTLTVIMVPVESFPAHGSIQNNYVQHLVSAITVTKTATPQPEEEKSSISAVVGMSVILRYPWQKQSTLLTVWNVKLINGTNCHLSYISSKNQSRTNCSENINWLSRPDQEYALLIKPVQIFNEGFYKCSSSIVKGTFIYEYTLTVLVPPQVLLTYGYNGTAVCVAAAGKPAAQISWGLKGDFNIVSETLPNGTETIVSRYNITSAEENNLTCHISHPAWNNSYVLSLQSGMIPFGMIPITNLCGKILGRNGEKLKNSLMPLLYSILGVLLGSILILSFIYLGRLLYGKQKKVDTSKSSETISRPSIQENEMEPYAIFVQRENVIYDTTFDTSVGKHFPPGLSPSK